jgi:hypothetical protein
MPPETEAQVTKRQDDPVIAEFCELLSEVTADFQPHPTLPEFVVPRRFSPLDPICDEVGVDTSNEVYDLGTTLFSMEWDSLPGFSSFWHLHSLPVPGACVYWVDDGDGRHILAVGPEGPESQKRFLSALFETNGEAFGTGIIGSEPSRFSTSVRPKSLVIALLASAFSEAGVDLSRAEIASYVRQQLGRSR